MAPSDESKSLVSIIVPMYHAAPYIANTIHCVEQQTWTNWELLLVDDCGGDDTLSVAAACKDASPFGSQIHIVQNERNIGAADSRNHGVSCARGRYIAFLDADDVWLPEKLERQLQFMAACEGGFTFTSYEFGDENAQGTGKFVRVPSTLTFSKALSRTVIFTSTVLLDTQKIPKELIHMPDIGSEDTALWWSLLKTGITACGLDEVLTIYRRPRKSLSSNKLSAIRRMWTLLRQIGDCGRLRAFYHLIGWAVRATLRRI